MLSCDDVNLIDYIEGNDPSNTIKQHLLSCDKCQRKLSDFKKLIRTLAQEKATEIYEDLEPDQSADEKEEPLPENIKEMIEKRKQAWKQSAAEKAAEKMGYKGQEEKDNIIKLITKRENSQFLNAAFPDDLLKGKRKKSDEDDKDE